MALPLASAPSTTARLRPSARPRPTGALSVSIVGCDPLANVDPQALGVTYCFEAAPEGEPYGATVRFTGHRVGVIGKPGPRDTFTAVEAVERVVPGSGRVAITTRVFDIAPGEWQVTARLVTPSASGSGSTGSGPTTASASGTTGYVPVIRARALGAHLGVWPALVSVGVAVALTAQSVLARRIHLSVMATLLVSVIASVVGLLGARVYYLAEHDPRALLKPRAVLTAGMCIQGFVLAAVATVLIGGYVAHVPVGPFLDVTAPSLLFGMTIGRFGCFFGGCCAGRPTASRWGLWSSDRRLGMRRVPTQLLESALALALGIAALDAVHSKGDKPAGAVFVGAIAAYTFGRQLLLPWRDLPRKRWRGRMLTMAGMALIVLADVVVAIVI